VFGFVSDRSCHTRRSDTVDGLNEADARRGRRPATQHRLSTVSTVIAVGQTAMNTFYKLSQPQRVFDISKISPRNLRKVHVRLIGKLPTTGRLYSPGNEAWSPLQATTDRVGPAVKKARWQPCVLEASLRSSCSPIIRCLVRGGGCVWLSQQGRG